MNYIEIAQQRVAENYPLIVYAKPPIKDLPPGACLGSFVYSKRNQVRFILNREVMFAGTDGVMPGDVTRAWINDQYKLPLRRRKDQTVSGYDSPLFARVGKHGPCVYVDMTKCYVQILKLGFDVEYLQGQFLGAQPRPVPPEIIANKLCYSMAISMSSGSHNNLEIVSHRGVIDHRAFNMFSNPCLFNLKSDTLSAVAAEMIAVLGYACVYANTDGYIVHENCEEAAINIVRSWGFDARVKVKDGVELRGDTEIYGASSYKVGEYHTTRYNPFAGDFQNAMMPREGRKWLKARWQRFNAQTEGLK